MEMQSPLPSQKSVIVIWGSVLPPDATICSNDVVITTKRHEHRIKALGRTFLNLDDLTDAGSIYEASSLVEELSKTTLSDGTIVSKAITYKGFELWWMHYGGLFVSMCLPYTRYKNMLSLLKKYASVTFYNAPHEDLFALYFQAYQHKKVTFCNAKKTPIRLGICLQVLLTCTSLPFVFLMRRPVLLSIGDKMDKARDHDPRLSEIYNELRRRRIPFVEYARSIEPWRVVLSNALRRRRPIIYSEAIGALSTILYRISGKAASLKRFDTENVIFGDGPDQAFKRLLSVRCLQVAHADLPTIRIMEILLRMMGTKAYLAIVSSERNFPSVLAAKIHNIPTIGILHGFASRYYNHYDFMQGYTGEKNLGMDVYGVWSDWWKEYYERNSNVYRSEQLFVSGPMRPAKSSREEVAPKMCDHTIRVLLVSEIVAVPGEVIPYLDALLNTSEFSVYIKFRPQGDSFEAWLQENRPDILEKLNGRIMKESMGEAIAACDVVTGSQSTGVIEATLQSKPFVFFNTKKWGDYYDLKQIDTPYHFFAEGPQELVAYIKESKTIPADVIKSFSIKFFGDPYRNGSAWAVDRVAQALDHDK